MSEQGKGGRFQWSDASWTADQGKGAPEASWLATADAAQAHALGGSSLLTHALGGSSHPTHALGGSSHPTHALGGDPLAEPWGPQNQWGEASPWTPQASVVIP